MNDKVTAKEPDFSEISKDDFITLYRKTKRQLGELEGVNTQLTSQLDSGADMVEKLSETISILRKEKKLAEDHGRDCERVTVMAKGKLKQSDAKNKPLEILIGEKNEQLEREIAERRRLVERVKMLDKKVIEYVKGEKPEVTKYRNKAKEAMELSGAAEQERGKAERELVKMTKKHLDAKDGWNTGRTVLRHMTTYVTRLESAIEGNDMSTASRLVKEEKSRD